MNDLTASEAVSGTLKKTFIALKRAEARIAALERPQAEPVAIVGMACRLPGGAHDPAALWDLLCRGVDASSPIPAERWPSEQFYSPDPDAPGRTHAARAHFLHGPVGGFDAPFFGLSAKEATGMDPQQRMLLELSWEALEDAGLDPAGLRGSRTGVFVGISSDDYAQAHRHSGQLDLIDGYSLTGTCFAPAAGRISYNFGFEGQSMAVDTACSSSLVAVHLACQSLRNGETALALAAGVNLILSPVFHIASSKLGTISPDGRCKTFDASADGYGRGEGCGVVVLKRLTDAQRDGDRVLAVTRGSAVNQDGRSNGLTAPNGLAQERVIREALDRAGLVPSDIGYIEVHGTGTSLGDPIEVEAIGRVMADRPKDQPVVLGTVKSNIGHLEAAAGIAGLIRAVQCLRHGEIPAHLNLTTPNPHIPWGQFPFMVTTQRASFPEMGGPRRAGISSFGFSGTNAHVILEAAPAPPLTAAREGEALLLPLSARTPEALRALATRWRDWLSAPAAALSDACATAASGRSHMVQRLAVLGKTAVDLTAGLTGFLDAKPVRASAAGSAAHGRPLIAGLFTGQGSQYPGMGRGLYESEPVFRETVAACDAAFGDRLGRRLLDVLYGADASDAMLQQTGFAQPAIFTVELALYRLWESWGVVPDIVCGHSIGEYAAAHVAAILPFQDAVEMVAERGRLMQGLPAGGAMAAAFAAEAVVAPMLRPGDDVSMAAVNTSGDVVVSGPEAAVAALLLRLQAAGIASQPLRVSHAFHSALMRPMIPAFEAVATRRYGAATLPVVSTVTGRKAAPGELGTASYWTGQIEAPVRFAAAAATLAAEGVRVFLEYGPSPVLAGLARRCVAAEGRQFLGSLLPADGDDRAQMLDSLARLYAAGAEIDWPAVVRHTGARRAAVPTYPFQRKTYYLPPIVAGSAATSAVAEGSARPYLLQRIRSCLLPPGTMLYQALFTHEQPAFLREHQIFNKIISPAAAHVSMAFAASGGHRALEDVSFTAPLVIEAGTSRLVQVAVEGNAYTLVSQPANAAADRWVVHSAGRMVAAGALPPPARLDAIRARCTGAMDPAAFYGMIETFGYSTGPDFRCIRAIHKGEGESLCRVEAPRRVDPAAIHPGLVDSVLQTVLPACEAQAASMLDGASVLVPLHMGRVSLNGSLDQPLACHTTVTVSGELVKAQVTAYAEDGAAVLAIEDFLLKRTDRTTLYQELRDDDGGLVHQVEWRPATPRATSGEAAGWVVFAEPEGWGAAAAAALRERGEDCLELRRAASFAQHRRGRCDIDAGDPDALAMAVLPWLTQNADRPVHVLFAWHGAGHDPVADCRAVMRGLLPAVQAIGSGKARAKRVRLWLLTRQAQNVAPEDVRVIPPSLDGAMLWGFGRAAAQEMPDAWGGLVDLDARPSAPAVAALLDVVAAPGGDEQLAIRRGGHVFAARLASAPARPLPTGATMLDKGPRRTLDDLRFVQRERQVPGASEVEIEVLTAGLNFRDVLNALGQYPGEAGALGFEAVGTVAALGAGVTGVALGQTVIALAAPGCIGSHVTVNRALVVPKPPALSAAEAVSLPAALLTAYYALHHLGGMERGDRVLIHAAAGGVGLAAVQLALAAGAEVLATAGAPEKQAHLRAMGVRHVMSSRTTEFAAQIREATGGRGVDMILNSLSGDFIAASFSVLAPGGRFLEMGKLGIWDETRVHAQDPSWLYRPFDLAAVAQQDPASLVAMFERLLAEVAAGRLTPLPVTVFPMDQAKEAFRFMAQARHIGKIVLSREDEHHRAAVLGRGAVRADRGYLVTGGLGALGLRVARWLVAAGARRLVLAGRRAPGEAAREAIAEMEAQGAAVTVVQGDVAEAADVARMVAASQPDLAGVVHAAGLLDDGMIADLDAARLDRVMAPKVAGAWHLHTATTGMALDFFVLFSSVAAIIGNLGQGGYAAANAFMDGLAAYRRRQGLQATSINWGPWAEAGMAATLEVDRFAAQGIRQLAPAQGLRLFGRMLAEMPVEATVAAIDWPAYGAAHGLGKAGLFSELLGAPGTPDALPDAAAARDIVTELRAALPVQREDLLRRYLQDLARQTLGYGEGESIAIDQPLVAQGFDSLMSVDMRNRLNRSLGRVLPASLLFDYPTLERIARYLLESMIILEAAPAAEPVATARELLDELERLTG
jgi:acyl transferase domain-containing protein/NADPH:quinone reductase-like Zn-dependent oxidoreductase/NADP-dependent 3-hydroxy acid dehydrogenase YdfG